MKDRVHILIPVYNNEEEIDRTIISIKNQDYSKDKIYVSCFDFGSTDGSYRKLISYSGEKYGIYKVGKTKNRRLMLSYIARIIKYVLVYNSLELVLYPGEELYPNCIKIMLEMFSKNESNNIGSVICEADVRSRNGHIIHQKPLYNEDKVIDVGDNIHIFCERGYDHQICELKEGLLSDLYRSSGETNEGRWWNKSARGNLERKVSYIHTPLIIENEIYYENELEEILLRWESLIIQERMYYESFQKTFENEKVERMKKNLAIYALWRSRILRSGNKVEQSRQCFEIAEVICPEIVLTNYYTETKNLFQLI